MTRAISALLLAIGLLLTGGCNSSQSGGESNPDTQVDEAPARDQDNLEEVEPTTAP
jgi:hypothetical protein